MTLDLPQNMLAYLTTPMQSRLCYAILLVPSFRVWSLCLFFAFFFSLRKSHNVTCGHIQSRYLDLKYCRPHLEKAVLKELQNIKYLGKLWTDFHNSFLFYFLACNKLFPHNRNLTMLESLFFFFFFFVQWLKMIILVGKC